MKNFFDNTFSFVTPPSVGFRREGNLLIIVNTYTGEFAQIDDQIGIMIWEMLMNKAKLSEIQNIIVKEYKIDQQRCREDINSLINQLISKDFLLRVDSK